MSDRTTPRGGGELWVISTAICLGALTACTGAPTRFSADQLAATERIHAEDTFELGIQSPERVAVTVDGAGQAHVLTITHDQALYDLVVGAKGVERTELVAAHVPGRTLSAVFDAQGRLRVVIRNQHFLRDDRGWRGPLEGPECYTLLLAGKTLLCAYLSKHALKGADYRFDWVFLPQLLIVPPLPLPMRNQRVVIECLAADGQWVAAHVLDPFAKRDVEIFAGAADDSGTVRILYQRTRTMFLSPIAELVFATRRGPYSCPPDPSSEANAPFVGTAVHLEPGEGFAGFALAANRTTGEFTEFRWNWSVLAFQGSRDTGAIVDRTSLAVPPVGRVLDAQAVAADAGRFHVLLLDDSFRWRYLALSGKDWSAPIELAGCKGLDCSVFGIASGDSGRALVVWSENKTLRAKWITLPARP